MCVAKNEAHIQDWERKASVFVVHEIRREPIGKLALEMLSGNFSDHSYSDQCVALSCLIMKVISESYSDVVFALETAGDHTTLRARHGAGQEPPSVDFIRLVSTKFPETLDKNSETLYDEVQEVANSLRRQLKAISRGLPREPTAERLLFGR